MNKRLIREHAIAKLVEHDIPLANATKIVDEHMAAGLISDRQTRIALILPESEPEDFEIVDLGTYEIIELTPNRTPRRRGHLRIA